jgi:hypothetical protein
MNNANRANLAANSHPGWRKARSARSMARSLGWFSIGLGIAELVMPHAVARATGMRGRETLVRAYGLREIATGIGLLVARDPTPWVWGRVAGDALDLATLGAHAADPDNRRAAQSGVAIAAVAGVTALDVACAQSLTRQRRQARMPSHDYSNRRGLPLPPAEMRGAARDDFEIPADMQTPPALRPYSVH